MGRLAGKMIREASVELGVADATYLRTHARSLLDGKPWHGPIGYDEVEPLARMLETACCIVIAFLSGMRASEVKHIKRGSVTVWRETSTTNADMIAFGKGINDYCRQTGRHETVPLVNSQEWKVTTSQFRRTLACFIARRPGGVIAGALQFRHLRVQMFEGYAGTSDSGFRDEVEAEDAIARGEQLGELIVSHKFPSLHGPAAAETESRLAEFERHVQFHGKVFNDDKRLQWHINRHDPHIYPGEYVTCVHNPDRALCRRSDGEQGPSLPDCQPLRCRNVALTSENIAHMRVTPATYDRRLAGEHLAPLIRHRLEARRREIGDFLTASLDTGSHPGREAK